MLVLHRLIDAGVAFIPGSLTAERTPTAIATIGEHGQPHYTFDVAWSLPRSTQFLPLPELLHIGSYSAFLAPGGDEVLALAKRARDEGITVTFDPNIRPDLLGSRAAVLARFERIAGIATVVKLSDDDARWLYPALASAEVTAHLLELGVSLVAMTLGGEGSALATASHSARVVAPSVAVVDSVGAGDSYMAALIHCILESGQDADLGWVGHRASAAAAITIGRPGADPPWFAELGGELIRLRERRP